MAIPFSRTIMSIGYNSTKCSQLLKHGKILLLKPIILKQSFSADSSQSISLKSVKKCYPQPTPETHPTLLKDGEISPLIHRNEYQERRSKLMNEIFQASDRSKTKVVIVPSSPKVYMSGKIPYVFRQDSDFFYLTGCLEPDAILVLVMKPGSETYETTLFFPKSDQNMEMWEGPKLDQLFCQSFLGIQHANFVSEFAPFFSSLGTENQLNGIQVWRDFDNSCPIVVDTIKKTTSQVKDIVPILHYLRVYKSKAEQELMRKTCIIASNAVQQTMKVTKANTCESQLWASVDYHSRMGGAQYLAYPPVIAGGPRANTIHYISNNQLVEDGDMVLMDAGCQYHGYTSDLTRCWPVNGRFDRYQKQAYEALLDVQVSLIEFCKQSPPLDILFQRMCHLLGKNLQEIGFGTDSISCAQRSQMGYSFCPHHVSHYLGLDVHDTGRVTRNIPLRPGMVITIEPGVYVDLNQKNAPKEFHGLGLRIEDDILITETGVEVLTRHCPKSVSQIEETMNSQ